PHGQGFLRFQATKKRLRSSLYRLFYSSSPVCHLKLKDFHKSHEDSTSSGRQAIVGHLDV
ncbi:hypothetical protein, partial [Pantoea septica]|uniref:hypothetical protein n=1 Tax=Pantoea septica TaxID=472695 RepID=UPI001AD91FCE